MSQLISITPPEGAATIALAFGIAWVAVASVFTATMFAETGFTISLPDIRLPRVRVPRPRLPRVTTKRVGGLRFVKVGRLSVSWCITKAR